MLILKEPPPHQILTGLYDKQMRFLRGIADGIGDIEKENNVRVSFHLISFNF